MMSIPYADNLKASKFAVQSYAALVLARQQKTPLDTPHEVREHRADIASGLPLLQLDIASKAMGGAVCGEETIVLTLKTPRSSDERIQLGDYSGSLRDSALMLSLLEENKLLPDEQHPLLNTLSQQVFGERWLSTQESNALFPVIRTLRDLPGRWQAQTTFSAESLTSEKTQASNPSSDQLAILQVTDGGGQLLWLCVGASGYPQPVPLPASNVLQIEHHALDTDGKSKSLDSLCSSDLVLMWLRIKASSSVPDALVMDPLSAGPELENRNLASSSANLEQGGGEVQSLLSQMQQASIKHIEFRDDCFVTVVVVDECQPVTLVYLAWTVTPGTYQVPQPMVESIYTPQWRTTGAADDLLITRP